MEKTEQTQISAAKAREWPAYLAWVTALLALVGSLFFSEVMQFPPCVLCWYQRVAIYPLVAVVAVGIVLRDRRMKYYALPLAVAGLLIAGYHNLLYYGVIPEEITPCSEGTPCSARQLEVFGFVTIPLLSLAAFVFVTACLLVYKPRE